ncbi:hypothetical protein BDD12DRAFT_835992 [Trichophaea hybrida]|nr:hypothetical protein BDD12DRAFT_835992 [Trichophaea hybrida]
MRGVGRVTLLGFPLIRSWDRAHTVVPCGESYRSVVLPQQEPVPNQVRSKVPRAAHYLGWAYHAQARAKHDRVRRDRGVSWMYSTLKASSYYALFLPRDIGFHRISFPQIW